MAVIKKYYPNVKEITQSLRDYLRNSGAEEVSILSLHSPGGYQSGVAGVYHYSDSTVVLVDLFESALNYFVVSTGDTTNDDDTKAKKVFGELEAKLKVEETTEKVSRRIPQMDQI